jgi:hypothetical protein
VTADSWPAFLYPHAAASKDDVECGLFRSAILVKVCTAAQDMQLPIKLNMLCQAFKFIFTSPTSAQDINDENDVEDPASLPTKHLRNRKAPTRGHVANILGMRSVTPRAIAYVAVQVVSLQILGDQMLTSNLSCTLLSQVPQCGMKMMVVLATLPFITTL